MPYPLRPEYAEAAVAASLAMTRIVERTFVLVSSEGPVLAVLFALAELDELETEVESVVLTDDALVELVGARTATGVVVVLDVLCA